MSLYTELFASLPGAAQRRLTGIPEYVDSLLAVEEQRSRKLRELSKEDREQLRTVALVRGIVEGLSSATEFANAAVNSARQFGIDEIRIGSTAFGPESDTLRNEAEALRALNDFCVEVGLDEYFSLSWQSMITLLVRTRPWHTKA